MAGAAGGNGGLEMTELMRRFARDESGAVTVDWVVITAAIVGLGIAVFAAVGSGVENVAGDISTDMASQMGANYSAAD